MGDILENDGRTPEHQIHKEKKYSYVKKYELSLSENLRDLFHTVRKFTQIRGLTQNFCLQ